MSDLSPAGRLEANIIAYIAEQIIDIGLTSSNSQVLSTNSFEPRKKKVIIEVDAQGSFATDEMGFLHHSDLEITVSGQVDSIRKIQHARIANRVLNSLVYNPPKDGTLIRARDELVAAVNKPGAGTDTRPAKQVHLFDMFNPSSSLGQTDATADTIITTRADFVAADI